MNYDISQYVFNYCRSKLYLYVIFKVQFNMKFVIIIVNPKNVCLMLLHMNFLLVNF